MFCKFCGSQLPENAKFCASCGGMLNETITTENNKENNVTSTPVPPASPTQTSTQKTPTTPPKSPSPPRPPVTSMSPAPRQDNYKAAEIPKSSKPVQEKYFTQNNNANYNYSTAPVNGGQQNNFATMSVMQYLGTFILCSIPIVGFILLLIWAFGSNTNTNKKNLARAMLLLMIIGIALYILFGSVLLGMLFRMRY